MASRTNVELIDDLDGSEANENVIFSLDGINYSIDLSGEHATELRDRMAPFVESARKVAASRATRTYTRRQGRTTLGRTESQAVREWARENGEKVNDRGRIPGDLLTRFQAARAELVDA